MEIDISKMEMGETLHVSDLSFENVEIVTDGEVAVVSVLTPMAEEAVEEVLDQEEPEIIGQSQEEADSEEAES